ncbi:ribosome small subunit-dependent GTPase A [Syntrophomonas curvata]
MKDERVGGLVLKNYGGFYYVQDSQKVVYECKLRGKVKKQVLSGDRVLITSLGNQCGILESILPRRNELVRPRVANADLLLIVMANDKPAPSLVLLDGLLVNAYFNNLIPYIIINKKDLPEDSRAAMIGQYYPRSGFNVIRTSVHTGCGIDELRAVIKERIAVMAGPSGSGKSSLLNSLVAGAGIRTQEVSNKIGRGRHTTRHVELYPLGSGGWIADTPGFSVLNTPDMESHRLADYYPDFQNYTCGCKFGDCLHYRETDCGVKDAVTDGRVAQFRYQNYIAILEKLIQNERCYS